MKAIRKTAPEPLPPIPFNIPQPNKTTLENGLRVVIFEDRRLPLVSFRMAFLSGDIDDPEGSVGLTSAVAAMLTEGTQNYSSRDLAQKIERIGGSLSANASDDFTVVSGSALSLYGTEILQLISEILFRPTFPENELDLYRRNTVENLKFQRSQPGFLANEQAARLIYGDHPYSRISPGASDIEKLTRGELINFHRQTFVPNNAVLIAVGDVETDAFIDQVRGEFGAWPSGEWKRRPFAAQPQRSGTSLTIVDRPGSAQANIVMANKGIDRHSPDYFPLLVMNQILGAGASSRVFMNLREEKGYTYGAYTRLDAKQLGGDFEATAEVRTAVTGDSLKEFMYELNRIRADKASDEELRDAKNFLTGVFPIRAETQEGLTGLILNQELYGLPEDYLQTYREKIDAVTLDDVLDAAKKYVLPDQMAIVIVGDAEDVFSQASEYADSHEVFDTNGKPLDVGRFAKSSPAATANAAGTWELSLDFQGQAVPVTMTIDQDRAEISGSISTPLGEGSFEGGNVSGNRLKASSNIEIQGQTVEFAISAAIDDGTMNGQLTSEVIPQPLSFSGSRK